MSVEVKGVDTLIKQHEDKYGGTKLKQIEDDVLSKGTDFLLKELKENFESFKDTGASIKEMTKTKPYSKNSNLLRAMSIKWEGPLSRQSIIHLNEHGYTRNGKKYIPRGFGVIAKTIRDTEEEYRNIIVKELKRKL